MRLRIKTKIALGFLFIFSLILINGGMGYYYLNHLAGAAEAIIRDNYQSLQYCRNMSGDLDDYLDARQGSLDRFNQALQEEEHDITETGEGELAGELRSLFDQLKVGGPGNALITSMRRIIYKINHLNMQAILRKNNQARETANSALITLEITTTLSFLIGFTFLINFPGYIGNPVIELTESIKAIAGHNYSKRLHFNSRDEFGELAAAFNAMASRLDEYEHSNLAKINFEKKRIETLVDIMKDAIIGLDEGSHILFANALALSLLNMESGKLIGSYAPDVAMHNDLLHRILQPADTGQLLKIYSGGRESYFTREVLSVLISEEPDDHGLPVNAGQVIILKNITRFQELDMARTNFIATISHELKTPISSIKMSLKLLEDQRVGNLNGEQHELVGQLREDSERLLDITRELLDLAQVETGNMQLHCQPTHPSRIMAHATHALIVQIQQKDIKLETICGPEVSEVMADPEKTAWVLVNFLSNAIRHSPEFSRIIMEAVNRNGEVLFSVQDFGKGIDPQYRERIFEKFFRVPGSPEGYSGTGLGLAISREFIMAQGGKIWVESESGSGSKFFFSLPGLPVKSNGKNG